MNAITRRTNATALGDTTGVLGQTTFDIYLNGNAYWRNVPAAVWRYKLGGYQVLKKWLSYRERGVSSDEHVSCPRKCSTSRTRHAVSGR